MLAGKTNEICIERSFCYRCIPHRIVNLFWNVRVLFVTNSQIFSMIWIFSSLLQATNINQSSELEIQN
jgi:hypothetical protein